MEDEADGFRGHLSSSTKRPARRGPRYVLPPWLTVRNRRSSPNLPLVSLRVLRPVIRLIWGFGLPPTGNVSPLSRNSPASARSS